MVPTVLVSIALVVVLAVVIFTVRRSRASQSSRLGDLGVVSARWISELRRDEPWGGS